MTYEAYGFTIRERVVGDATRYEVLDHAGRIIVWSHSFSDAVTYVRACCVPTTDKTCRDDGSR